MNIIFVSRYGSSNIGDALIVRELEKLFDGHNLMRFDNVLNYYPTLDESFISKKIKKDKKQLLKKFIEII